MNSERQRGLSLLEVLICLVLVVVGLMALTLLSFVGQQSRLDALTVHRANSLAQNLVEQSLASAGFRQTQLSSCPAGQACASQNGIVYWAASAPAASATQFHIQWHDGALNASTTLCLSTASSGLCQ